MKTKYPMRVGQTLYPKDTTVRPATDKEIFTHWPLIKKNDWSNQVAVLFPGRDVPTICAKDQFYDY